MIRTRPHRFVEPRYTYAQTERALAAVFKVDVNRRGPLKARLKHLNALGLPGLKVGKGQRIAYTFEWIAQLMVALLIEETGVDPIVAAKLVKGTWEMSTGDWVRQAADEKSKDNHVFLKLQPLLMTGPWGKLQNPLYTVRSIGGFRQYRYSRGREHRMSLVEHHLTEAVRDRRWICLRDLTADFEVLTNSLDGEKS
jgi:hypothetical protein